MNATRKVKLNDITANLTCKLCLGYLVDATTIIECLHSFCKSCILKYLDKSADLEEKYCPVCDVQLHSTKPLTSIRSDLMLQEIVYKLVPGLFKNEMSRRREFYEKNKDCSPSNQLDSGQVFDELYITSDDIIHLSLEYVTEDIKLKEDTRRYLKCPAAVSVFILKKFIQGKFDLDLGTRIDIMFGDRILPDDFLLMDVAYKYSWTMNGSKPLSLRYRIQGRIKPIIKAEKTINDSSTATPEPPKAPQVDSQNTKKKVCNENGSNIMPSEEIKHNPIKIPGNGLISGEITIAPIKTPNGKVRGRKRKLLNYSDIVIVERKDDIKNLTKRMKLPKQETKSQLTSAFQSPPKIEIIPAKDVGKTSTNNGEGKEVQLHISENGVMSARSVPIGGNGEDKIILNLATSSTSTKSNPSPATSQNGSIVAEKLLLSGNFHSKTGPSGVTEIICDKPDPISGSMKPSTPKPGYVTLNIPNPSTQRTPNSNMGVNDKPKKLPITNLHDSSSSTVTPIRNGKSPSNKKSSDKTSKSSLMDKIKSRIASKGKDGENVIKAISDLGKLCNNSSSNGTTVVSCGSPSSETNSKMTGVHNLPIIQTLASHLQQPARANKVQNSFPFPLNFPPSSGMSVSMIPCTSSSISTTTNNSSQSATPPKRVSHQTTVVNGDMKFTTSPKQTSSLNGDHDNTPKKPPKFFKSRHTTSPGTPPGKPKQPSPQRSEVDIKRKTPVHMGNGTTEPLKKKAKDKNESQKGSSASSLISRSSSPSTANLGIQSASNFSTVSTTNGIQVSRPIPFPSQSNESVYAQQIKALNGTSNNMSSTDALNSSFGMAAAAAVAAAAATANGNGMRQFLPQGYASMPFDYSSLLSHLIMPQYYPLSFTGMTSANSGPTMSYNLIKPKPNSPPSSCASSNNSKILNALLSSGDSKSEAGASTLDLSVGKNGGGNEDGVETTKSKDSDKHPVLSHLLNGKGKKESASEKSTNSKVSNASVSPSIKPKINGKPDENRRSTSPTDKPELQDSAKNGIMKNGNESCSKEQKQNQNHNETLNNQDKPTVPKVSTTTESDHANGPETKKEDTTQNGTPSTAQEKDKLSPTPEDMLLSQNNNNHSSHENKDNSADNPLSLKKSLESANPNPINEEINKNTCNGNNNVPAHTADINSNSGSA